MDRYEMRKARATEPGLFVSTASHQRVRPLPPLREGAVPPPPAGRLPPPPGDTEGDRPEGVRPGDTRGLLGAGFALGVLFLKIRCLSTPLWRPSCISYGARGRDGVTG